MRDIAAEVDAAGLFRLFPAVFKTGVENQLGVAGDNQPFVVENLPFQLAAFPDAMPHGDNLFVGAFAVEDILKDAERTGNRDFTLNAGVRVAVKIPSLGNSTKPLAGLTGPP